MQHKLAVLRVAKKNPEQTGRRGEVSELPGQQRIGACLTSPCPRWRVLREASVPRTSQEVCMDHSTHLEGVHLAPQQGLLVSESGQEFSPCPVYFPTTSPLHSLAAPG